MRNGRTASPIRSYDPVPVHRAAAADGARIGSVLGAGVVILAVLGLSPAFSWIPEIPLVLAGILMPMVAYALAGSRAAARTRHWPSGLVAGAVAGAISGAIGGLSYALFGKSLLNIAVGLALGTLGGALIGATAGLAAAGRSW
jgi:uncharacterized membrane protein YfcA